MSRQIGIPDKTEAGELYLPFTPPVNGDFSWINQGGASVNISKNGGIYLFAPAIAGDQLRIRKKIAPSRPYTITAFFIFHLVSVNFNQAGLLWRQSSDGKLITLFFSPSEVSDVRINKWTNPTVFNSFYIAIPTTKCFGFFLRIYEDNTNRICSWSNDGQNFIQIHSVGRTDYLTANEVGFFVNASQAFWPGAILLLSWQQT